MHNNISFFIPLMGCKFRCSFCDQREISGQDKSPSISEIKQVCNEQISKIKNPENTEIAFFGGTFTALPREKMIEYLESVQEFIGNGKFSGIRLSTRPDAIDSEIIEILKYYHVSAIELGAQSMKDEVLLANKRGHTAEMVEKSSEMIKSAGFELGLQMMTGLFKSSLDDDRYTAKKIAELKPKTVRIYPTVIIGSTDLGRYYKSGIYKPANFDDMAELCGELLEYFENQGITVIKCGLHAEKSLESDIVGGYYHPAFREIAEGTIFRRKIEEILKEKNYPPETDIYVDAKNISKAIGQHGANREYFQKMGIKIKFCQSRITHGKYWCGTEN